VAVVTVVVPTAMLVSASPVLFVFTHCVLFCVYFTHIPLQLLIPAKHSPQTRQ
jgi:hypothetical protein